MSERDYIRWPFGKHEGKPISKLSVSYMLWVMENLLDIEPRLRGAVAAELRSRGVDPEMGAERHHERQRESEPRSYPPPLDVGALVTRTRRELAMRYHPDRAGPDSHGIMVGINIALDRLEQLAGASA